MITLAPGIQGAPPYAHTMSGSQERLRLQQAGRLHQQRADRAAAILSGPLLVRLDSSWPAAVTWALHCKGARDTRIISIKTYINI